MVMFLASARGNWTGNSFWRLPASRCCEWNLHSEL